MYYVCIKVLAAGTFGQLVLFQQCKATVVPNKIPVRAGGERVKEILFCEPWKTGLRFYEIRP
jgi:hypothetical protein